VNKEFLKPLVTELATQVNKVVNIPFVSEEQEQLFFEMIIMLVLETLLRQLVPEYIDKLVKRDEV
jgi:hypothetical protein